LLAAAAAAADSPAEEGAARVDDVDDLGVDLLGLRVGGWV
jgi:hypothetical protein